jgi:hypothetical protein
MAVCLKCGGKLQGEVCPRHGSPRRAPARLIEAAPALPTAKHNPWSPETDRRVWALAAITCKGCTRSCGDYGSCPLLRAKWFGDWSGEREPPPPPCRESALPERKPAPKKTTQLSLF